MRFTEFFNFITLEEKSLPRMHTHTHAYAPDFVHIKICKNGPLLFAQFVFNILLFICMCWRSCCQPTNTLIDATITTLSNVLAQSIAKKRQPQLFCVTLLSSRVSFVTLLFILLLFSCCSCCFIVCYYYSHHCRVPLLSFVCYRTL